MGEPKTPEEVQAFNLDHEEVTTPEDVEELELEDLRHRHELLLEATGVLLELEEDVAIRVRARLLLAELTPAVEAYRRMNGTTPPQRVPHATLVANILEGAVDGRGNVTSREHLEGAVAVLRWLVR